MNFELVTRATLRKKNNFCEKVNEKHEHQTWEVLFKLLINAEQFLYYYFLFLSESVMSVCEHYSFLCTQLDDFEQRFLHTFVHMFSLRVELTSAKYEVVVTA